MSEGLIVVAIVFLGVGTVAGAGFALHVWARRVAQRQSTSVYRRLRWLPACGMAALAGGFGLASILLVSAFSAIADAEASEKARILAESISEAVNVGAIFILASAVLLGTSAIASFVGTLRRPPP